MAETQRANPLNTPMTASYNDPVVAVDELGREIRMTRTGQRYLGTDLAPTRPQATAGRGLGYNILDNIIGYDDGVDTPGERAGAAIGAIASDPIGAARGAATGIGGLIERLVGGTGTMGDVVEATGLLNLGSAVGAAPRGALRAGAGRDAPEIAIHRSADEFQDIDLSRSADGTFWLASPNADWSTITTSGRGIDHSFEISPEAKLATWDDIDKYTVDQLEQMGFDGVRMDDGGGNISYQIWNTNVLQRRAPDQTPAQRVAGLLASGRADEVTDEMMAAADAQEMARLYASGATGMDLPMDYQSRMARAIQQGFDVNDEMYRGDAPRSEFQTGRGQRDQIGVTMSTRPDVAASYIPPRGEGGVYPLLSRGQNDAIINAEGRNWNVIDRDASVDFQGDRSLLREYVPDDYFEAYDILAGTDFLDTNDLSRMFQGYGADRVRFNDLVDRGSSARYYGPESSMASDVMMVANPANVRSRFARFDPRLSHLSNLNAANASPLLGGAVLAAPQEQPDPLRNLRGLLAR